MPLIYQREIDSDSLIAVWRIDEKPEALLSMLQMNETEMAMYNSFTNEGRKAQWLSVRVLIRMLLNPEHPMEIKYDEHSKPFLIDSAYHVSISHSGNKAAVLISKHKHLGLDIENIHPRIDRVISKFISSKELSSLDGENIIDQYHIYWGAKEALYKLNGKKGLEFKRDIHIHPFRYKSHGDTIAATVINIDDPRDFNLEYMILNGYMIVWVID